MRPKLLDMRSIINLVHFLACLHFVFNSTQTTYCITDACIDQKTKSIAVVLLHTVRTVAHTLYHIVLYGMVLYYIIYSV